VKAQAADLMYALCEADQQHPGVMRGALATLVRTAA
jgi:hypothetical protein